MPQCKSCQAEIKGENEVINAPTSLSPAQLQVWIDFLEARNRRLEDVAGAASRWLHASPRQSLVTKRDLCRAILALESAQKEKPLPVRTPVQQAAEMARGWTE
jgi:hypothetical protein